MSSPEEFLLQPLLDDEGNEQFQAQRRRVAQRHGAWRINFPSFAGLLDSEEERAHALAGNYSTEARETIGVWLAAHDERRNGNSIAVSVEDLTAWLQQYQAAWRVHVLATDDVAALDGAARERFLRVFGDLQEKAGVEALSYLQAAEAAGSQRPSLAGLLLVPLRAVGRGVRRFFFPGGR